MSFQVVISEDDVLNSVLNKVGTFCEDKDCSIDKYTCRSLVFQDDIKFENCEQVLTQNGDEFQLKQGFEKINTCKPNEEELITEFGTVYNASSLVAITVEFHESSEENKRPRAFLFRPKGSDMNCKKCEVLFKVAPSRFRYNCSDTKNEKCPAITEFRSKSKKKYEMKHIDLHYLDRNSTTVTCENIENHQPFSDTYTDLKNLTVIENFCSENSCYNLDHIFDSSYKLQHEPFDLN